MTTSCTHKPLLSAFDYYCELDLPNRVIKCKCDDCGTVFSHKIPIGTKPIDAAFDFKLNIAASPIQINI